MKASGRDPVGALDAAVMARGMRTGLYYSGGYDVSATEARTPPGRLCSPDEMTRAIETLAIDQTFITGVCPPMDGGWTVVGK